MHSKKKFIRLRDSTFVAQLNLRCVSKRRETRVLPISATSFLNISIVNQTVVSQLTDSIVPRINLYIHFYYITAWAEGSIRTEIDITFAIYLKKNHMLHNNFKFHVFLTANCKLSALSYVRLVYTALVVATKLAEMKIHRYCRSNRFTGRFC